MVLSLVSIWSLTVGDGLRSRSVTSLRHVPETLSGTVWDTRSEWSEELNLILLSRPLWPRLQRKILNGNASLGRSATIGDRSLFLLNQKSVTAQWELRLLQQISNQTYKTCEITWSAIANKIWKHFCGVCDSSIANGGRRWSLTVADRYRSYGNQASHPNISEQTKITPARIRDLKTYLALHIFGRFLKT